MKYYFLLFSLFLSCAITTVANSEDQVSEKELLKAVKNENIVLIADFLDRGNDINGEYGKQKYTLLNYAIKSGSNLVFNELMLKMADINKMSRGKTPLMFAVDNRRREMIAALAYAGADIDAIGKNGNTALIYAAQLGKMNCVKVLVENGADAELCNKHGFNALDYANFANYFEIATYLVKIIEMRHFYDDLEWTVDGPHIEWENDTIVRVFYMVYDTSKRFPVSKEKFLTVTSDTLHLKGFAGDTKNYSIVKNKRTDQSVYKNVEKVLALGDVHGHYEALFGYLFKNGIINDSGNWIWGDGHVILMGDVFDRGNQVTESLWLIYQLDLQARAFGGRVHMLLGNHEVMIMTNDIRYLNKKYVFFSKYFFKDYSLYFDENSELGQWLRTRNAIIKVNGNIFSHAGLSPVMYENDISINNINRTLRNYLSDTKKHRKSAFQDLILGSAGPLWYRGYLIECNGLSKISQTQVDQILNFYNGNKMVVAHTESMKIKTFFNDKVIAVDVPVRTSDVIPAGLFIHNDVFYILHFDGSKEKLF